MAAFLWYLVATTPLAASPLYGGYNGQSMFWMDVFFFGIDDQARWWVRIPVPLVKGFLRLNFKYERDGVVSAEITGYNFFEQSDFLLGVDTSGLTWGEYYELNLSGGSDNHGTTWTEQTFFEYVGTGSDNNNHLWGFVTYNYENTYPIKVGIDLSFLIPESFKKITPSLAQREQKKLLPLTRLFQKEEILKLIHFLTALSIDDELRGKVEALTTHSLELELLVKFADEEVFTQERREVIETIINGLIDAKGMNSSSF